MKKPLVALLVIGALIAAALWIAPGWIDRVTSDASVAGGGDATGDAGDPAAPDVPSRPDDAFPLTVRYVYDGDTIQAQMRRPNDIVTTGEPIRIRLIGIDTPEGTPTVECGADEARDHLEGLLPEGAIVWAAPDRETWDRYDRRLFYLWTDDGTFVNHDLVRAGHAEALRIPPNEAHFALFQATEQAARDAGAGQWGACG